MSKKRSFIIISTAVIAIVILIAGLFVFHGIKEKISEVLKEAKQSERISALEARIEFMEEKENLPKNSKAEIWPGGGTTI